MEKLEHIGIAVKNLDESNQLFAKLLGKVHYKIEEVASEGVRTSFFEISGVKIELLEATREDSPIAKFLERNPRGGIHHFSLAAENFDAAIESLTAKGVSLLGTIGQQNVDGDPIAFIHPKDFLGSLVELESH